MRGSVRHTLNSVWLFGQEIGQWTGAWAEGLFPKLALEIKVTRRLVTDRKYVVMA
jgi:hypothetical protein